MPSTATTESSGGCVPIPSIQVNLPAGISIIPPSISASLTIPNICCLLPLPPVLNIALPLPPLAIPIPLAKAINTELAVIEAYLDSLQPKCPRQ